MAGARRDGRRRRKRNGRGFRRRAVSGGRIAPRGSSSARRAATGGTCDEEDGLRRRRKRFNGLVAAGLLAKRGRKVTALERDHRVGRRIRTETPTGPGFVLEAAGAPMVRGAAETILAAFRRLIEDRGGPVRPGADLAALSVNLGGGDPYGGYRGIDQFLLSRPFRTSINHRTRVPRLRHIGAPTHPGPGLGAGFVLAQALR
jgi:hypothetical protein